MTDFTQIKFNPTYHSYTYQGKRLKNVTGLVSSVKRPFDREGLSKKTADRQGVPQEFILAEWDEKARIGREKGSAVHAHIEWVLNGGNYLDPILSLNDSLPETEAFNTFWENHGDTFEVHKIEWVIGDAELGIAGTADTILFSRKTGQYHLFDWKTGKLDTTSPWGYMLAPFDEFEDCNLNHYSLQLSIYRLILERNTDIDLGNSYIIHLSEAGEWRIYPTKDLRELATAWLSERVTIA